MNDFNNEKITPKVNTVEIFDSGDEESFSQIRNLEKQTFDWEVTDKDLDELINKIKNPKNISLILKDVDQLIVGYLIAVPSDDAMADISSEDELFEPSPNKLYIETFAISKESRGSLMQIKNLFQHLVDTAKSRSYGTIGAHIPTDHLPLYERFSDVEVLRTIEDWFESGEDHFYIEIKL
jgi:hypothetical protein